MSYTIRDMQRDALLAANKAQVDHEKEDIAAGLREVAEAISTEVDIDPPAVMAQWEVTVKKVA
jgi:hypothetical protein